MGNSGILSFAHMGFMGVGAYTSAVLTIPVQMKGMALPDLYPFLQGVELSPYLAIAVGGIVAGAGGGGRVLSADAAIGRRRRHHLLRAAGRALHGDDQLERADQRAAHAVRPAEGDGPHARGAGGDARADRRAGLQGIAHRPAAARQPRRRARGRRDGRQHSGAALARLHPGGAVRRGRRRAVGAFHHLVLAEGLLSEGDLPDPVDAGDRRRQHGDRRGGRHLHRHHRL